MAERPRILVAGAGAFGREHLRRLAAMDDVVLAGVADCRAEAARAAAERWRVRRWGVDATELMAELRPDGVVVATPGDTHLALARCALGLGIPVLVEKPVTMTVAQAEALAQAEAASAAFVLPGHILRFSEAHRRVAEIAQSDAVGPLLWLGARRHRDDDHALRYPDIDPVLMTMIHDIDLALWITGAGVRTVRALRRPAGMQRALTTLVAEGEGGVVWQLATAWTFPGTAPPDRLEVIGERGSVELEVGAGIRQRGAVSRDIEAGPEDALRAELACFAGCIRAGTRPQRVTLADARAGLAVAEAAMRSLATGAAVRP
ncbi:MAG: Gfo/Idh/MocA family oxidoreductase [Rhodospirillaceae bacterium]|nr:Gfo/Idh/MocA family oxidoreductase [Rhodospirillaceae bacterium]